MKFWKKIYLSICHLKGNVFKVKSLSNCTDKTCFPFVLNEVFEEVAGNAEGKVSHGVFLQLGGKKIQKSSF